jgi:hypothetical protein
MPGFTPAQRAALLDQLLARRAAGETFKAIAATPGWPSRPTLRKWLRNRPDLDVPPLRARPTHWSATLARDICRRVLDGESLRAICADPAMPDRKTLHQWARARPVFARRLADARARSGAPATGRSSRFRLTRDMVVNEICLRLCDGETGEQACAADPDYPVHRTLYDWRRDDPDIDRKVCEASRIAAETKAQANLPDMRAYLAEVEAYRRWITETAARPPPPKPEAPPPRTSTAPRRRSP